MSTPVVHVDELEFALSRAHGGKFAAKFVPESAAVDYWHGE